MWQSSMGHEWCMLQVSRMKSEVPLAAPPKNHPAAFVLGAEEDLIVDVQAVEETAALYHVQPHILQNSAHDVMLVCSIAVFQMSLCPTPSCAQSAEARPFLHNFQSSHRTPGVRYVLCRTLDGERQRMQ